MAKLTPHVDGEPVPEGTTVIGFQNAIDTMLTIGILRGDYMVFEAMSTTFYALTQDQLQRARQQLQQQTIYQGWITAGYWSKRRSRRQSPIRNQSPSPNPNRS